MSVRAGRSPTRARLVVDVVDAHGRRSIARGLREWLERVAPPRASGRVVVAIVPDAVVRRLNRDHRGVNRATDVLSFPAQAGPPARPVRQSPQSARRDPFAGETTAPGGLPLLGDIVIAHGMAQRQAQYFQHDTGTELRVLALHGLLHLLGYDHEVDGGRMAQLEARLRRAGRLREGLIERTYPAGTRPRAAHREGERRAQGRDSVGRAPQR